MIFLSSEFSHMPMCSGLLQTSSFLLSTFQKKLALSTKIHPLLTGHRLDSLIIFPILFLRHIIIIDSTYKHMQRVATQITHRLTMTPFQGFCAITRDPISNPIKERVMSTPQWPVPYYQRLHKAYPVREKKTVNLTMAAFDANDTNWYNAKNNLKATLKGRQLVEYTENHIANKTYMVSRDDCEAMAKAYVDDVGQFLDIANRENVRILKGKTLI